MSVEIICTLGPASLKGTTIERLADQGASLFRLNLSHTPLDRLRSQIEHVRRYTDVPLCLDTEGAQVRTGLLAAPPMQLVEHKTVRICADELEGDATGFNLYPTQVWRKLRVGDLVSLDFNAALVQVVSLDDTGLTARVVTGGAVGQNKAVSVDREVALDALTDKDRAAIEIGQQLGITHYALSFAANADEVAYTRSLVGAGCRVIAKIESTQGLRNQRAIAEEADAVLIDRGDLSRQIPIEAIPAAQKQIIATAHSVDTPAYVATNLLETMIDSPNPTRAEVNDIYNTLGDGASGLVLAAETAIGDNPVKTARMLRKVIDQFVSRAKFARATTQTKSEPPASLVPYRLTSQQAQAVFESKGWGRVASVCGPGLAGRLSVETQKRILLECKADGLLLNAGPDNDAAGGEYLAERVVVTNWDEPTGDAVSQVLGAVRQRELMGCTHCLVVTHDLPPQDPMSVQSLRRIIEGCLDISIAVRVQDTQSATLTRTHDDDYVPPARAVS